MVKRIFTFLNKEYHGVNEAALLLGGFAFVSQLLGLVRDRTLAHLIGPGPVLDIYYAAFRIPDFLYISIASLASITVLMPFLVEKMEAKEDGEGREKARKFMNNIFSAYMLFMVGACFLVALLMPYIAHLIAPGFDPTQASRLIVTSRIMLLSPIFIGLSNLIGTITQYYKNFLIFSLSPIFYNVGILCGIFFLYPSFGVYGLAIGVVIGAILHFFIQMPVVALHGFFPKIVSKIRWKEVFDVVKLSAPRTFTLSCNSLAFLVLIAMASTLKSGSISLFTFSYNLQSVPAGIIGISYAVAAFPILVRSYSQKNIEVFITQITSAARHIIFWSLPVISLIIVLRAQIVRVILGSGTFTWTDTRLTAAASAVFIICLASQGLVLLLVRGYYAASNTRKPFFINVFSSLIMIVFAYIFLHTFRTHSIILPALEKILRVQGVPGTAMLALPMAFTLGSLINFILIWILFKRDFLRNRSSGLWPTFVQSTAAAIVMGVAAYYSLGIFDGIFGLTTGRGIFLQGFLSGIIGLTFGVLALALMKNKELADVIRALGHKFWKRRVLAPEQKEL